LASPAVGGRASVPRPAGTGHETAPSATAPRSRPTVVDSLEEETRLLSSAARAAKSGAFERAFAFVDEHEQRFPKGQLAAERDVQRISLLCSTGRDEEARRRAKAFLEGRESSALTRRVEQSCAAR
jgi:hypothetical protein